MLSLVRVVVVPWLLERSHHENFSTHINVWREKIVRNFFVKKAQHCD